ncbi:hypothetical protein [Candidatus Enterococcus ferrettii]|uniref:Lipoprotein n=1 Tax=Candidatus Enterococcus ferrettii TaxID=2815324 RepID=A0ABV0ELS5_9ENTE|nr:hypothetical protein [Enterococcus sp. 665A]MBO1342158.1 hypothetical protein [Enterococcus sp. 665A]
MRVRKKGIMSFIFVTCLLFWGFTLLKTSQLQGEWLASDVYQKEYQVTITKDSIILKSEEESEEAPYRVVAKGSNRTSKYESLSFKQQIYTVVSPKSQRDSAILVKSEKGSPLKGEYILAMNKKHHPNYLDYGLKYFK